MESPDHQAAREALARSAQTRELVTTIARRFVVATDGELDPAVDSALSDLVAGTGVDHASVYRTGATGSPLTRQFRAQRGPDALNGPCPPSPLGDELAPDRFPTWYRLLQQFEHSLFDTEHPLRPQAGGSNAAEGTDPVTAAAAVPMVTDGRLVGVLLLGVVGRPYTFNADATFVARLAADIIAAALARRDASAAHQAETARLRALVENSSDALIVVDENAVISHMPVGRQLFGYRPEELVGKNALELVHPDDIDFAATEMLKAIVDPTYQATNAMRIRGARGEWIPIELVASSHFDDPAIGGVIMNVRDHTERDRYAAALRVSEERQRTLIANVPGAVFRCELTPPYRDLFMSEAIFDLTGYEPHEFRAGHEFYDLVQACDREQLDTEVAAAVAEHRPYRIEYQIRHADGSLRWVEERGQASYTDAGDPVWLDGALMDLTDRKRLEERLAHDAAHDPLTGLPNRSLLLSHLESTLARAARKPSRTAVLFVDLDRFKLVNDALGHTAGDELLVHFTRRLLSVLRTSDLAARTGGDEFVVVCTDLDSDADATAVADRVASVLADPFSVQGRNVFVTASIGIAHAEADACPDDLLRSADAAAYRAKDRGRNRYEVFDDALRAETTTALETETDLHRALDGHQLFLRYQPVIDIATGRLCGAEALIRWQHPRRGLLLPDAFLPAAEVSGLIIPIGREMRDLACGALADVPAEALPMLAVNLSARELVQADLVVRLADSLAELAINPTRLCIEITETAIVEDINHVIAALDAVRAIGVRIAIDDFGTGYSSLSYLRQLPADTLKIDRSFTRGLGTEQADITIVAGIIGLARGLGLDVIAEGVETEAQARALAELGCTMAQGYLYSPPVTLDELLRHSNRLATP